MAQTTKKGICKVAVLLERGSAGTILEKSDPSLLPSLWYQSSSFSSLGFMVFLVKKKKKKKVYFGGMEKEYGDIHICHPALLWAL